MRSKGIEELCKRLRDDDELRGQRVSELWLKAYLDAGEQAAVSRLSVFAGSFNAVGAAAVAYEAGAAYGTSDPFYFVRVSSEAQQAHLGCESAQRSVPHIKRPALS